MKNLKSEKLDQKKILEGIDKASRENEKLFLPEHNGVQNFPSPNPGSDAARGIPSRYVKYGEILEQRKRDAELAQLEVTTAINIVEKSIDWFVHGWIALGELTLICGLPNIGKTTFYCTLAAIMTRGGSLKINPAFKRCEGTGHVLIFNNEDNPSTTLNPRLIEAGADLSKVHYFNCKSFSFSNQHDIDKLITFSEKIENNIGLIILDPVYLAIQGDAGNNMKAREAFQNLTALSKRFECAVLGVCHAVKNPKDSTALSRVGGVPALRERAWHANLSIVH